MKVVISHLGKQFLVSEGETILINKVLGKKGDKVKITDILLVFDNNKVILGKPSLEKAEVEAELVDFGKCPKIQIIKFRAKKRYQKKIGHRQQFSKLKINKIRVK